MTAVTRIFVLLYTKFFYLKKTLYVVYLLVWGEGEERKEGKAIQEKKKEMRARIYR